MEFNFTIEGLLLGLCVIPFFMASYYAFRQYYKMHFKAAFFWGLVHLITGLTELCASLSILFRIKEIYILGVYLVVPLSLAINSAVDIVRKERVNEYYSSAICFLGGLLLWFSTESNAILEKTNVFGETVYEWSGNFLIIGVILFGFCALKGFFYTYLVFQKARYVVTLQKEAWFLLFAGFCYIITVILAAVPIIGYQFFLAIASVIMAQCFYHKPQLFFLLEFKALRLVVINENSGIPLFTYSWRIGENLINEIIYAGVIQGVKSIMGESLNRGQLTEMKLANAKVILEANPEFKVFCCLAVTQSSETLRNSLKLFMNRFVKEFSKEFASLTDTVKYESANNLIHECFPFLPD